MCTVYSEMSNLKQENKKLRSENMMLKDELKKLESKFDEFRDCVLEKIKMLTMSEQQRKEMT